MKTVISVLIVLALIVLFAQIVLPRGSYTSANAAKKPGRFVVEATSSRSTVEGVDAAWAKNTRDHFSRNSSER